MIRVQCPHCQRRYRTKMEAFGRIAVCTKCARTFKIGESRPPFQWKATDLGEDSWIGVPEPEEKKEIKHCITCDAPLRPEMVRCPECGTNQVTGMVHKSRHRETTEEVSFWSTLPLRPIGIALAVVLVCAGIFWTARAIGRKGVQIGDEMADTGLTKRVAAQLDAGEEESDAVAKYAGMVKDANIERFAQMLASGTPTWRRAAGLLIGAGQQTNLAPVVAIARSDDATTAAAGLAALEAIGARQIVNLSNHQDEKVRHAAAEALTALSELDRGSAKLGELAKVMSAAQKIKLLNEACRPWPELVGAFTVKIDETASPFPVRVEQIGRTFYLQVGQTEFVTVRGTRQFTIPIHRWCAATGSAVDPRSARELLSGVVVLAGPTGAVWEGQVTLTARRKMSPPLPGFLPFEPPEPGQTIQAPVRLVRPW